ncbi:MAG: c-type cytochrome domain-containing protein, partial [Rhodopirellula sp. JB053]
MVPRCRATLRMLFLLSIIAIGLGVHADDELPSFQNDIRPLLSDHCFSCHGPDENNRESGVRLDTSDGVASVVDLDAWEESLLVERIRTDDPDMIMPPPHYHKPLDEKSKALLEAWVRSGAEVEAHWSFIPPTKQHVDDATAEKSHDRIDYWIEKALEEQSLSPNGPTDRTTLARRVA